MISVIINAGNDAAALGATFQSLFAAAMDGVVGEVIVCGTGLDEPTRALANEAGAEIVEASGGPVSHWQAGAEAARRAWLLFLEPGAVLDEGWGEEARDFCRGGGGAAAIFRLASFWQRLGPPDLRRGLLIDRALYLKLAEGAADDSPRDPGAVIHHLGRGRLRMLPSKISFPAPRRRG